MGKIYTIDEITAAVKPIAEKYGIDKVWLPVDIVSERALTASYASVSSKQLLMNARKDGIQIYGKKQ